MYLGSWNCEENHSVIFSLILSIAENYYYNICPYFVNFTRSNDLKFHSYPLELFIVAHFSTVCLDVLESQLSQENQFLNEDAWNSHWAGQLYVWKQKQTVPKFGLARLTTQSKVLCAPSGIIYCSLLFLFHLLRIAYKYLSSYFVLKGYFPASDWSLFSFIRSLHWFQF